MPPIPNKPFWTTNDRKTIRLYLGEVRRVLLRLPAGSVHCIVTSPPYWGLRDYDVDGQIGLEATPEEYVENIVAVFRELHRVLRDDGTCWLNLGDSYGSPPGRNDASDSIKRQSGKTTTRLAAGNLVGIPWRVALALQADGWVLRQDIIWSKPSPMPESVRNRCTKAHEYLFLLAKRSGYFYDAEAIRESSVDPEGSAGRYKHSFKSKTGKSLIPADGSVASATQSCHSTLQKDGKELFRDFDGTRNKRSVWTITSESYPGAHFATFPKKLVEPCILAGTSEYGCCPECGAPWNRIVEVGEPEGGHQHKRKTGSPYALEKHKPD